MWNDSNRPVQMYRNNKLDRDVQRIVQPFNIILSVFFTSKYKIRNTYIAPCGKYYQIILFFSISIINVFSIYHLYDDKNNTFSLFNKSGIERTIFFISDTMGCCGYLLLIICNIAHSRRNISLVLKIQEIHRSLDIGKSIPNFIVWNWIALFTVLCIIILPLIQLYIMKISLYFVEISRDVFIIQYDLNLIYGIRLTTFMTMCLKEWVNNMQSKNNDDLNEECCDKLFLTYQNILEAFKLFTKCFRILVRQYLIDN